MMLLPLIPSIVAMFAASLTSLVILPDANPSLFYYDQLFSNDKRFQRHFQGKRVWITGASSGIGAELAQQLYQHGAKVILSGRREEELQNVAAAAAVNVNVNAKEKKIREGTTSTHAANGKNENTNHDNISVIPFDVTADDDTISNIVSTAIECYNGIDILILNAGSGQLSPAQDEVESTTRALMEVNFMGPMRIALEVMKQDKWGQYHNIVDKNDNDNDNDNDNAPKKKKGHIVVTSSVASKMALPLGTSYAASKHAVHGYFASLRSECGEFLRVDLPCPGPIATNFQSKVLSSSVSSATTADDDDDGDDEDASEVKMPADRCARLILSGMMGPASIMQETWISRQPTLSFMFLNQYVPNVATSILGKIGPLRLKAFRAGLPLYKVSSWIQAAKMEKEEMNVVGKADIDINKTTQTEVLGKK